MSSKKSQLRLIGALAALATLALAVSCRGFFVNPTLSTITVSPTTPTLSVTQTTQMYATGTFSDNSTQTLKAGSSCANNTVCWSESSGGTVITISSTGLVTGVSNGSSTVTAQSGAVTGTTSVTVATTVTTMTITPSSTSVTDTGSAVAQFKIMSGTTDLTPLVTLTAEQNGTPITAGEIPCAYNSTSGFQECTPATGLVPSGTSQVYTIVVTYSGYTGTQQVSAQLTVNG
ncbi:MAG TPA: Ig-like domain-containing protein [Candidatus Sulfotelmatobacter sp.]|nr:Ig-like domain-containing protein [Candidatus Sulfotelmatobacter sp.]